MREFKMACGQVNACPVFVRVTL